MKHYIAETYFMAHYFQQGRIRMDWVTMAPRDPPNNLYIMCGHFAFFFFSILKLNLNFVFLLQQIHPHSVIWYTVDVKKIMKTWEKKMRKDVKIWYMKGLLFPVNTFKLATLVGKASIYM